MLIWLGIIMLNIEYFAKLAYYFDGSGLSFDEKKARLDAIYSVKNKSGFVLNAYDLNKIHKYAITFKTLLKNTPSLIKKRSQGMNIISKPVTRYDSNTMQLNFRFTSLQKKEGTGHNAWIALLDGDDTGDVKVHCDCKYFTFWLEYNLAQQNASDIINSNGSAPKIRNVEGRLHLCKHLVMAAPYLNILEKQKGYPDYLRKRRRDLSKEEIEKIKLL